MTKKHLPLLVILILFILPGCEKGPQFDGYLWFGQEQNVQTYDLAANRIYTPAQFNGCSQVAADLAGSFFYLACNIEEETRLRFFNTLDPKLTDASVTSQDELTDPALEPRNTRLLYRLRRAGDVFDAFLLFHRSGSDLFVKQVGAATFGRDANSIYFAQGNLVASHVIDDITDPGKMPRGGLKALVKAPGAVRDLHFHPTSQWLLICAGTQVLMCDETGGNLSTILDTTKASIPGPLYFPYRARWSPDATRAAVLLSADGQAGRFMIVDVRSLKKKTLWNMQPVVGGFAWTAKMPVELR